MKVAIETTDRIGISHDILAAFALHSWNLRAVEIESCFIFVFIEHQSLNLEAIKAVLAPISDIVNCKEITLMPTEVRENHLHTLLSRIPDPIIDIDQNGKIIAFNQAAINLLPESKIHYEGRSISEFTEHAISELLTVQEHSVALTFINSPFIADINPVISDGSFNGAVICLRAINKLGRQISMMQSKNDSAIDQVIGESEKVKLVLAQTLRFAQLDLPVLINGETGTGKELIARALHQSSARKNAPFLTINCAALPEQLLESELFGYESGAFTGATKGGKPGLIELAEGGTVFLDEIAEMSIYLQAKLLRFLQDFTYRRVGGTKELKANIKVISASHQNFQQLIEKQLFREDLYYRLNVLSLDLPPLKKRIEDIPLLVAHFLKKAAVQVNADVPEISARAYETMQAYDWPGNIRQLENVIFRLVALNESSVIDVIAVNEVLYSKTQIKTEQESLITKQETWAQAQQRFEKSLLEELYPYYPTTRKLAERLNVSHNKIAMKLRAYSIPSKL